MRRALLAALALSCTHLPQEQPEPCSTSCGLRAVLIPSECRSLEAFQDRLLRELEARAPGFGWTRSCSALGGWRVRVRADVDRDGCWGTPFNRSCGYLDQPHRAIVVGLTSWGDSSLGHELVHAIARAEGPITEENQHAQWRERGICAAINAASDHFHCDYSNPAEGGPIW